MGVSKKGKRKIIVDELEYYWHIVKNLDDIDLGTDRSLIVTSDDKKFLVRYPINQHGRSENLIVVLGKQFGGNGEWGNSWCRVKCPQWEVEGKITPASVEKLIRWSLLDKINEFVDYLGNKAEG